MGKQLKFPDMEAWHYQLASRRFLFQCGPKQFACHIRTKATSLVWSGFKCYNSHERKIQDITM